MKKALHFLFFCLLTFPILAQTSIGIIGTAVNGWDTDVDMVQNPDDVNSWSLTFELKAGELKFRADDGWALSWGNSDFPVGIATSDNGPNVQVTHPGVYNITFNTESGLYYFESGSPIGIIGDASPLGWDTDVDMFQDAVDANKFSVKLQLLAKEAKFRLNNDWAVSWGDAAFPSGVAGQPGSNIKVGGAGEYVVTFDTLTKEYTFENTDPFKVISIIGSAAIDWNTDVDMVRDADNPDNYTLLYELKEGELKFRANNDWIIDWGGDDFPSGTGVLKGPNNIQVSPGGLYYIKFNTTTAEYSFELIEEYSSIDITGDAAGGFDVFSSMERVDPNGYDYRLRKVLTSGDLVFVANGSTDVFWGATDFPTGTAVKGNSDLIPVTAGEYLITFNYVTGEYNFKEIIEYNAVSVVGKSGPFGEWPADGDMGAKDFFLEKDATNGDLWTGLGIELTDFAATTDGGVKFRADTAWAVNWGAVDFPAGTGVQNGPNIEPVAGVYNVAFNAASGEYVFSPSTNTKEVLTPDQIKVYPNPASNILSVEVPTSAFEGLTSVKIFTTYGQLVSESTVNVANKKMNFDIQGLHTGAYLVQVSNEQFIIAKNFQVIK